MKKGLILFLIICAAATAFGVDRNGLVGEWTFNDGTANDTSGNGNNGTGTATVVDGISGRAFEFDGATTISVNEFSSNFTFDQAFTIEFWVYPQGGSATMIRKGPSANFLIELGVGRTNDPGTTLQFGFATSNVNIGASIFTGPTLPMEQWKFVTLTYDGQNLRGYVDGELIGENPVTGSAVNNTAQPLLFGNYASEVFFGRLDEIRIWNQTLPPEQIASDFLEFAPTLRTSLVGEWLFEGNPNDTSGNGNNGAIAGAVTSVPGIGGQAYDFNRTGTITIPTYSDNFVFSNAFSLSLWVRPLGGSQTMIRKGGSANFLLELGVGRTNDPGTNPQFGFATDQVGIGASIVYGPSLPMDQWSYLVMSYDGALLRGYINGVLVVSNPVTGIAVNNNSQILHFGTWTSEVFIGQLDDIRIWSRTLREGEIQGLFSEHASQPNVSKLQIGRRVADDLSYSPERPLEVAIELTGQPGAVTVAETPPAGWAISNISHGGQGTAGVINWNLAGFAGSQTISYVLTPPATATGSVTFTGKTGDNDTGGFTTLTPSAPIGIFENHLDVGEVLPSGGTMEYDAASETYTITASGKEIWNHMDNFHFAYIRVNGDFTISCMADILPLDSSQTWMKAGLVVRDDLSPQSSYAVIFVRNDLLMSYEFRPFTNIYPDRTGTLAYFSPPD